MKLRHFASTGTYQHGLCTCHYNSTLWHPSVISLSLSLGSGCQGHYCNHNRSSIRDLPRLCQSIKDLSLRLSPSQSSFSFVNLNTLFLLFFFQVFSLNYNTPTTERNNLIIGLNLTSAAFISVPVSIPPKFNQSRS